MMCTAKTRTNGHTARISCVSVWASSIVLSSCCTEESSWRMLSLRHSIGNAAPLESLARNSKSVPHLRCYATPPPTKSCARSLSYFENTALFPLTDLFQRLLRFQAEESPDEKLEKLEQMLR